MQNVAPLVSLTSRKPVQNQVTTQPNPFAGVWKAQPGKPSRGYRWLAICCFGVWVGTGWCRGRPFLPERGLVQRVLLFIAIYLTLLFLYG